MELVVVTLDDRLSRREASVAPPTCVQQHQHRDDEEEEEEGGSGDARMSTAKERAEILLSLRPRLSLRMPPGGDPGSR